MAEYRLSILADHDLGRIADYTIETFGLHQARRYAESLKACFNLLARNPGMGRKADELAPGLNRFNHQSHVIFYRQKSSELLIVRVLHESMDFEQHPLRS